MNRDLILILGYFVVLGVCLAMFFYFGGRRDERDNKPCEAVTTAATTATILRCPVHVDAVEKPPYLKGMKPYVYPVLSIIDVHDGDSGWVNLDLGFQISRKVCYRLDGLDTPEVTGSQKSVGLAVRDVVEAWLKRAVICESKSLDKYGRALVVFYDKDGNSLNEYLLSAKLALGYHGENKSVMWSQAELRAASAAAASAKP